MVAGQPRATVATMSSWFERAFFGLAFVVFLVLTVGRAFFDE